MRKQMTIHPNYHNHPDAPTPPPQPKNAKEKFEERILFCTATLLALILARVKAPASLLVCIPIFVMVGTQLWVVEKLHPSMYVQILLTASAGAFSFETAFILTHHWIA
jgi:hypothetical protein